MASDLDSINLTGRLTRDAELRHTPAGTAVLKIRLAWTTRHKAGDEWGDKSNFIDVTLWGERGAALEQYLGKGDRIAVSGRLEYREWDSKDGSGKRHDYEVVADNIVLLGGRSRDESRPQQEEWSGEPAGDFAPAPEPQPDFAPAASAPATFSGDDDIPF